MKCINIHHLCFFQIYIFIYFIIIYYIYKWICYKTKINNKKQVSLVLPCKASAHKPSSNTPLQTKASPSSTTKCLTLGDGKALVRVSASMSSVGQ